MSLLPFDKIVESAKRTSQCPWAAVVHLVEQCVGFRVTDDLLVFRIPFQRTPKRLRDIAQVVGVMERCDVSAVQIAGLGLFTQSR